jgi:hypothetical protein
MSSRNGILWMHTCSCGKRSYASRRDARHAAKAEFPNRHMSEYRCADGSWHYGQIHVMVREGLAART